MKYCSVEGCGRKHEGCGFCRLHLKRFKKFGSVEDPFINKGKRCKVDGCEKDASKTGLCNKHYLRQWKHGTTQIKYPTIKNKGFVCSVDGCDSDAFCKGYCSKHYQRMVDTGSTNDPVITNPLKGSLCRHCNKGVVIVRDFCGRCYYKHMMVTSEGYREYSYREWRRKRALHLAVHSEPYTRKQVFEKSGGICGICGLPIETNHGVRRQLWFTVDHIQPISKGGEDTLQNVQAAHNLCNMTKNNLVLAEDRLLNLREKISKLIGE